MLPDLFRPDRNILVLVVNPTSYYESEESFTFTGPYFISEVILDCQSRMDTKILKNTFVGYLFSEQSALKQKAEWEQESKFINIFEFSKFLKKVRQMLLKEMKITDLNLRTPLHVHIETINGALEFIEKYKEQKFKLIADYVDAHE